MVILSISFIQPIHTAVSLQNTIPTNSFSQNGSTRQSIQEKTT